MSLDKSIKSGKEHRKPYRKAKAVDTTCRNHGSCEWCQGNRQYKNKKRIASAIQYIDEVLNSDSSTILPSGKVTDIGYCIPALEDLKNILKGDN